jgi:hypothetical protein
MELTGVALAAAVLSTALASLSFFLWDRRRKRRLATAAAGGPGGGPGSDGGDTIPEGFNAFR